MSSPCSQRPRTLFPYDFPTELLLPILEEMETGDLFALLCAGNHRLASLCRPYLRDQKQHARLPELAWAAKNNNVRLLQRLLSGHGPHGAAAAVDERPAIDARDPAVAPDVHAHWGRTALHFAASAGHVDAVRVLLDHRANPAIVGTRPVAAGADGALRLQYDCPPLHCAATDGSVEVARLLLTRSQVNVDERGGYADGTGLVAGNSTALMCAAASGHVEMVSLLLEHGASNMWPDGLVDQMHALHWAARAGHAAVVRLLLDTDAATDFHIGSCGNLEHEAAFAWSSLHFAAAHARPDVVRLLLDRYAARGYSPDGQDADGRSPLICAVQAITPSTPSSPFSSSSSSSSSTCTKTEDQLAVVIAMLLDAGANPALPDDAGRSALYYAVDRHAPAILDCLLEHPQTDEFVADNPQRFFHAITLALEHAEEDHVKVDPGVIDCLRRKQLAIGATPQRRRLSLPTISWPLSSY